LGPECFYQADKLRLPHLRRFGRDGVLDLPEGGPVAVPEPLSTH